MDSEFGIVTESHMNVALALVAAIAGQDRADALGALLVPMIPDGGASAPDVTCTECAAAMNMLLFADLLNRVPSASAYVEDVRNGGAPLHFDHGAIRTVALRLGDTGALPRGELAIRRILEPLGYEEAALYPLPRLKMTGRAYRHRDFPETIPQFFVSELHVDRFDDAFGEAAERVFGVSRDPLDAHATEALAAFVAGRHLPFDRAVRALPAIVAAFERQHDLPTLADYELLKRASPEAAWIATEGNAFNHATDRVADVVALAERQKRLDRPMKETVEISSTGRVRQTAFRADPVERVFRGEDGSELRRTVPGSFYEFISRDIDPDTGALDLSFDSGNATGIFNMTKAA